MIRVLDIDTRWTLVIRFGSPQNALYENSFSTASLGHRQIMSDIDNFGMVLKIALGAAVLFNAYVSIRLLFYGGNTFGQKFWQLLIVWFLPIVGGLLVHSLIVVPRWKENNHGYTRDDGDNPPGIGMNGHL